MRSYTFTIERVDPPGEKKFGFTIDAETVTDLPAFAEGVSDMVIAVLRLDLEASQVTEE